MKKHLLVLFIICLAISACASEKPATLIGSWELTAYGPVNSPTPAVSDAGAELTFNGDGTVTGNSGCNGFGGSYTVEGDQITFESITSTLMACEDARMAQESAVTQVLTGTAKYKIEGSTLTLTNDDRVLVFTTSSYP